LLRLIDLDWMVPNFSTLSRRQKTLKVNIPFRGSAGPLHRKRCVSPVVSAWGDFGHAALQLSLQEFGDGPPK
jgi:hypothetical protein